MNRKPITVLKVCLVLIGLAVLGFCGILPLMMNIGKEAQGELANLRYPVLIGVYGCAVAFFIALYQSFKLLTNIERDNTFSDLSVKALKNISYCAGAACAILVLGGLPFFYHMAQLDDAPGLVIIGLMIALVPFVIGVFSRVLRVIFQDGIRLKAGDAVKGVLPQ